jgi:pantoate--beta-alanine ligase
VIQISTRSELREAVDALGGGGGRVGLVPTMGYLHEGHLSLLDLARGRTDVLCVSVFVNPLQFGPGEDLDHYPRDLDRDLGLLEGRGVDLVFSPTVQEMYPQGEPLVTVDPGPMARRLCGRHRPGHFRGVLTVVARLFGLVRPHVAVFGQKDFQQGVLIRRMVADLALEVEVVMGRVIREPDGLALSSRNVHLSPQERAQATGIRRSLLAVQEAFRDGQRSGVELRDALRSTIEAYPLLRLQYGEIVDPRTLESLEAAVPGAVVAVAAHCGATRLIDNHILEVRSP